MITTRCLICSSEFTDEEIKGANCCPNCKTKSIPLDPKNDVTIKINIQELRILGCWGENWAHKCDTENKDSPHHESMMKTIDVIANRIENQLAHIDKWTPLTMTRELKDLKESLPNQKIEYYRNGEKEEI